MIEIVPYKQSWPAEFASIGRSIRAALGDLALAIHHIGSTSVPGLCAKDIIDIQITVAEISPEVEEAMTAAGFLATPFKIDHCPPGETLPPDQLEKRLFKNPARLANIHLRVEGKFNQRYPLLCRDYFRSHPGAANAYAEIKLQLARYFPENVDAYYDIKDPVFDIVMSGARDWAVVTAWAPPPTDA